jgi:hypothetical protein
LDEILEEILNNLPRRRGTSLAELSNAVRQAIECLREQVPLQIELFDRAPMKKHAKKLFQAVMKLELLLETAPGMMPALLFSDLKLSRDELPSKQAMKEGYLKRSEVFFNELYDLHLVCRLFIGGREGTHGNFDFAKSLSAWHAHGLMENYSVAKITGTEDARFRTVTSLLYEALSGHRDADLKRACDALLPKKKRKKRTGAEAPVRRGGN